MAQLCNRPAAPLAPCASRRSSRRPAAQQLGTQAQSTRCRAAWSTTLQAAQQVLSHYSPSFFLCRCWFLFWHRSNRAVRSVQFVLDLGEIISQFIKMRASTCPSLDTPHANPHLDALDQHKSPTTKANPVVPVRACHMPRIKHTYRYIKDTSPKNHKEQF